MNVPSTYFECVVDGTADLLLSLHGALALHHAAKRHQVGSGFPVVTTVRQHQILDVMTVVYIYRTHSPSDGQRQLDDNSGLDLDGDEVFLFTCPVAQTVAH